MIEETASMIDLFIVSTTLMMGRRLLLYSERLVRGNKGLSLGTRGLLRDTHNLLRGILCKADIRTGELFKIN